MDYVTILPVIFVCGYLSSVGFLRFVYRYHIEKKHCAAMALFWLFVAINCVAMLPS